ncbi:lipoyl synthase, partial [Candidatus Margulisiibacteriota bacterium]
MTLPKFLVKRVPKQANIRKIRSLIEDENIHTVCESASCPNIGECFSQNTLTFMILGNVCTRNCKFCGVEKGTPLPPDPEEPKRIAQTVEKLGLKYVVITSVTRDDLPNGGAAQFAAVIRELLVVSRKLLVEVLIPDLQGDENALKTVLAAKPYVLNHNLETVPRLYPQIRPQANYQQSLKILKFSKKFDVYTKSGFMVGLGESQEEIVQVLADLHKVEC